MWKQMAFDLYKSIILNDLEIKENSMYSLHLKWGMAGFNQRDSRKWNKDDLSVS